MDNHQSKLEAQFELSNSVMAQMLRDQEVLAKQLESTGQAVAQLALQQKPPEPPPSPTHSEDFGEFSGQQRRPLHQQRNTFSGGRADPESRVGSHRFLPKLTCPRFDGTNPSIWKTKCQDYFHLLNVPESMWTTVASLHMDDNADKWVQMYKLKQGLGSWQQFMDAVQAKFGAYDYKHAIDSLLELKQTGTMEDYTTEFEALQYQITMVDQGMSETYFVFQFINGLKSDIRYQVHR